jgi:predicted secreted protein
MAAEPEVVRLRVGDEHPVQLAGLGSAGYRWQPELDQREAVAEVEAGGVAPPESDAVGASGAERFTIRALRPGVSRVHFAQRRPLEPSDRPPANEYVVQLHVEER